MKKIVYILLLMLSGCSRTGELSDDCVSCNDANYGMEINEENACLDSLPKYHNFVMNICTTDACHAECEDFCYQSYPLKLEDQCNQCLVQNADQYGDEYYTHILKCWADD